MWFIRKMAWPISLLYGLVVYIRNRLYDVGIFKSTSFDIPTVCIGNLSVGGTGKTPMIEYLISRLQSDYKIAVLSRGYKRKSEGFQLASTEATVHQLGDEPFQIFKKFPQVFVAVDANRRNGILKLKEEVDPDIILLDDAFQHRKVSPSFSILLTTFDRPYFKDTYLPTGSLRDSKYVSKRADIIVVTKCPSLLKAETMTYYKNRFQTKQHQKVVFATLSYDEVLFGKGDLETIDDLKGISFTLVTGIANPLPLVQFLEGKNLKFKHLSFSDHHDFNPTEIALLKDQGRIVTTEKDYVRLHDKLDQLQFIRVEHRFLEDGEQELLKALEISITPYR